MDMNQTGEKDVPNLPLINHIKSSFHLVYANILILYWDQSWLTSGCSFQSGINRALPSSYHHLQRQPTLPPITISTYIAPQIAAYTLRILRPRGLIKYTNPPTPLLLPPTLTPPRGPTPPGPNRNNELPSKRPLQFGISPRQSPP